MPLPLGAGGKLFAWADIRTLDDIAVDDTLEGWMGNCYSVIESRLIVLRGDDGGRV